MGKAPEKIWLHLNENDEWTFTPGLAETMPMNRIADFIRSDIAGRREQELKDELGATIMCLNDWQGKAITWKQALEDIAFGEINCEEQNMRFSKLDLAGVRHIAKQSLKEQQ